MYRQQSPAWTIIVHSAESVRIPWNRSTVLPELTESPGYYSKTRDSRGDGVFIANALRTEPYMFRP